MKNLVQSLNFPQLHNGWTKNSCESCCLRCNEWISHIMMTINIFST